MRAASPLLLCGVLGCALADGLSGDEPSPTSANNGAASACNVEDYAAGVRARMETSTLEPLPSGCVPSYVNGAIVAHAPEPRGGETTIRAVFSSGALMTIDGVECRRILPGQVRSSRRGSCQQVYACRCCEWHFENNKFDEGPVWGLEPINARCSDPDVYKADSYTIAPVQ